VAKGDEATQGTPAKAEAHAVATGVCCHCLLEVCYLCFHRFHK
jgi:hypothetical protein